MGESELIQRFASEAELTDAAAAFARGLVPVRPLVVGLRGDLGTGKTTWARAMLRGLGYTGRVPSPTYTLLEHYSLAALTIVHLDLYRLSGDEDLENLGLRDWLADLDRWLLIEWPERSPTLLARCDLVLDFEPTAVSGRVVRAAARTDAGNRALSAFRQATSNNTL